MQPNSLVTGATISLPLRDWAYLADLQKRYNQPNMSKSIQILVRKMQELDKTE